MELQKRLCIVFVAASHGVGVQEACDQQVVYKGQRLEVSELSLVV